MMSDGGPGLSIPAETREKVVELSELNVVEGVCNGRRRGVEENIKTGITIDLLSALGWDRRTQMDFEHNVGPKSADIALLKDGTPEVIVETKSLEKKLEDYKSQGLEYARKEGIVWTVMTNGLKTQLYKSTIPGVPDEKNEPIFESTLQELPQKFDRLYFLIGEEHIDDLQQKTEDTVQYIRKKISEEEFLAQLLDSKQELYLDLRDQFDDRYGRDEAFTEHIDAWVDSEEFDAEWTWHKRFRNDDAFAEYIQTIVEDAGLESTKTALNRNYRSDASYRTQVDEALRDEGIPVDWKDKLCNQGAYSFVNRIIFLRMYEDRVATATRTLDDHWLALVRRADSSDQVVQLLNMAFDGIRGKFKGMYQRPLFDDIWLEQLDWNQGIVCDIVERTQDHDFSSVDRDVLGEVYQNHIPKEVRKALGQFYTSPAIVRYMIGRVSHRLDEESKIIDPACGSGTFLIEAYRVLRALLVDSGWDEEAAHEQILSNLLYGVDIDSFATQLTTMNLLLRDLDHPQNARNIVNGNALTPLNLGALHTQPSPNDVVRGEEGDDASDEEPMQNIWGILKDALSDNEDGGFDLVIGNPPYNIISRGDTMSQFAGTYDEAVESEYSEVVDGRINIATLFIKRGLDLLDDNGVLAFVLPKAMVYADGYKKLRHYICDNCRIIEITDIGRAWDEVGYEQVLMFLSPEDDRDARRENEIRIVSGIRSVEFLEYGEYTEHYLSQERFEEFDPFPIYLSNPGFPEMEGVWMKMWENSIPFSDIDADVFRGFVKHTISSCIDDAKKGTNWTPILRDGDIGGDKPETGESWYIDMDGVQYVDIDCDKLTEKQQRFYHDRIVCKGVVSSDVKIDAAYDESASRNELPNYTFDNVTNIAVDDDRISELFLLGVLTSDLVATYIHELVYARATITMRLDSPYLAQIPIPNVPKTSDDGTLSQDDVAEVVETLISTKRELENREYDLEAAAGDYLEIQSDFNEARRLLQEYVFDAYGLTPEQRDTVEELRG